MDLKDLQKQMLFSVTVKKTIALYDTLIENHSEDELVAVLAHEVGHYKKKHILTSLILSIIQLGLMCFLFELCLYEGNISRALGSDKIVFHLGLVGFGVLYSPIGTIIGVFMNIISRKNEFESDAYAKKTYKGSSLELALKKLSVDNLTNLYPHPLYAFMHYSHPPLLKRLGFKELVLFKKRFLMKLLLGRMIFFLPQDFLQNKHPCYTKRKSYFLKKCIGHRNINIIH